MILTVNTSFPELDHLSAGLAEAGLLSTYVRPYVKSPRPWDRALPVLPGLGPAYARSLGRRVMPAPLSNAHISETAVLLDFLMAAHGRLPSSSYGYKRMRAAMSYARTNAVAKAAEKMLTDERIVIASWGCAEPVFIRAKAMGALCVLNYPLAHHRFTRRYLLEEAALQPAFADTLNSHDHLGWYERRLDAEIEIADHIFVGSSFVRDSFIREGVPAGKLLVIPYGADTRLFEPPENTSKRHRKLRLLFVGQLGQRKGISYLLEAMRQLQGRGDTLTAVGQPQGDGRALAPYRALFRHIPHVPRNELREIYRQADVFVFPTLVEGMPLAVLEAMASGLPVITTPNGPGDLVRDGTDGFLVPPRDAEAIIESVERLRADPELWMKMASSARKRALQFTWDAYRQTSTQQLQEWLGRSEPSGTEKSKSIESRFINA